MSVEGQHSRPRVPISAGMAVIAAAAALCLFAQCRFFLEPERATENYVSVRLNDSLSRFDSVVVQILADDDTAAIIGTLWSQRLDAPGAIPSYRLQDDETGVLTIRIRAWDADGRLVLDERIEKVDGKQIVTSMPIPKPSPRLASLTVSAGALSPAFAPGTHAYSLTLPYSQSNLLVTSTPEYAYARVFVGAMQTVSGKPSDPLELAVGPNRLTLSVFAADTTDQYILNVLRAAPPADTTKPVPGDTTKPVPVDTTKPATGDTLMQDWKHKGLVVLTLPSAAGLTLKGPARVADFPLLLRLNAANFAFSEAADSGRDLRFASQQGKLLDYAIARWDASAKVAEIYIRCDTLSAEGQPPAILMYWGNAKAAATTASAKVFSKDAGWTGVWHLEEKGAGKTGEYQDGTGRFPGTAAGSFPTRMEGPVGSSQDFNSGSQGWITLPNGYDPGKEGFTLNMWVFGEGRSTAYLFIKSGKEAAEQRFALDISQGTGNYGFGSNGTQSLFNFGPQTVAWQLLGIVCETDSIRIYTNGVLKESRPFALKGDPLANVIVGARNPNGDSGFIGRLDEIWSNSGTRGAWYMRLLYENQKSGSTLASLSRL